MRPLHFILSLLTISLMLSACGSKEKAWNHRGDVVDDYHGNSVADPYRWLEDENSDETKKWIGIQNKMTQAHLDTLEHRDVLNKRLSEVWNYTKYRTPFKRASKYYIYRQEGLQNQAVLYEHETLDDAGRVVIDPNTLTSDGTVALNSFNIRKDGKYAAYTLSEDGSDWVTMKVRDMTTGKDLDDELAWIKFSSASWWKDGFFYSGFPAPAKGQELSVKNENQTIRYHKLGTPQSEDIDIHADPDHPLRYHWGSTTEDGRFLIIQSSEGTSGSTLAVRDLEAGLDSELITIVADFDHDYSVVGNKGATLYVFTNNSADNYRLISLDVADPLNWTDVIAEREDMVLNGVQMTGGKFFANYLKDASTRIRVYDLKGQPTGEVELPGIGTAGGFGGEQTATETFYSFTSYTYPTRHYRYDIATGQSTLVRDSELDFDADRYETQQIWYTSKDGTKVPMFVTHKKGLELNGQNPCLLYGYGGFNVNILPRFRPENIVLLENGGIYAVATLRGGGEYGEQWHEAGMLDKKQNVFDDFIAAAEHLCATGYTSPDKLGISGRSNGGLLVGATMTQRPDLCKVAFPAVGVLDMYRYHQFTVGFGWVVEYGSSADPEQFAYLSKYSPLHNLKKGTSYPATMVTTAEHDDRVVPAHSYKFISELQHCHEGENPVLIRIDTDAGHGAGKPTAMVIQEHADTWAFFFHHIGVKPYAM